MSVAALPVALALAYHGDFLSHPGLSARAEWGHERPLGVNIEAEAGAYWHPNLMVAVFARTGPALRWTRPHGGTYGAFVNVGFEHGFWAAPTWRVVDGEVSRAWLAGDSWGTASTGVELGHTVAKGAVGAWFVRPQVGLRFPTFHGVGVDLAVAGGVRF